MGFFSWLTRDTHRSICNRSSSRVPFTVYLHGLGRNGERLVFREDNYEGYGVFGGQDYFELLSQMNPSLPSSHRARGIVLSNGSLSYPQFTESPERPSSFSTQCQRCPDQGFFYQ